MRTAIRAAAVLAAAFLITASSQGQDAASAAPAASFERTVRPFLGAHCAKCHGETKPKGDVRLDLISRNPGGGEDLLLWKRVLDQVRSGEMPPSKEPRPKPADVEAVVAWIDAAFREAERTAPSRSRTSAVRRMNSREYDNTIRDLFGMDSRPTRHFPEENTAHGFDTVGSALTISPLLMEKYLGAAEEVTRRALPLKRPASVKERIEGRQACRSKDADGSIGLILQFSTGATANSPPYLIHTKGKPFQIQESGLYALRVRVHSAGAKAGSPLLPRRLVYSPKDFQTVTYGDEHPRLWFQLGGETIGRIEATPEPADHEFRVWGEEGQSFGFFFENGPLSVNTKDPQIKAEYLKRGPGVALHWVEIEGPLFDSWPPSGHQKVFFHGPGSAKDRGAAQEILQKFAARAYRRPVRPDEVASLLQIFDRQTKEGKGFEQAVAAAIKLALCSPEFLYVAQPAPPGGPRTLDPYELASRMSYFLWSSMPDETLLARAADGSLVRDEKVLEAEVRRMLKDPKSRALTRGFLRQWLKLSMLDAVAVDRTLYADFDDHLRTSFEQETEAFFQEILNRDLSVLNFLDSDFAMLNERLARHYGIEGVKGMELRPVPLKEGSHRGGLLGQGSILTMTTCGTRTSPVIRGAWVSELLLGVPPPRPPKDVPDLVPDVRGIQSLRERLQKHREDPSCARCHDKIDPLGFALENYNVVGSWRTVMGGGERRIRGNAEVEAPKGSAIDAGGQIPGGEKFQGPDDFRRALMGRKCDFCRSLVEKLLIYALGRSLELGDRSTVESLTRRLPGDGYRLSGLIVDVVQSKTFRSH